MLPEEFIRNGARLDWKAQTGGMSIHLLKSWRTEDWKVEKYQDLAFELKRIHHVETLYQL